MIKNYRGNFSTVNLLFTFLGGLALLFIIAPLIGMLVNTPANDLFEAAAEKEVRSSIFLTLKVSLLSTLFFAICSIPLAYLLAKKEFFGKRLATGIVNIPVIIPHSAAGIAVLGFVSRDSLLGKFASSIGVDFIGNPLGIGVAMAFVSIPFLINSARDGFEGVPDRLEKAALNLGASSFRMFFTISLPLAWRNIVTGLIMMFARGLSEFGAVVIVAYHPMVTPVLIYERFGAYGLKYARPVSVIFILICLAVFLVFRMLSKNRRDVTGS